MHPCLAARTADNGFAARVIVPGSELDIVVRTKHQSHRIYPVYRLTIANHRITCPDVSAFLGYRSNKAPQFVLVGLTAI